ncbi:DUF5623 domain-containing protein [Iodobacter sp. HSC-16F04]|uniref:DUF5623 domain-containing protein n=1 Tax=Iodobacter violaceini TaxID=3044271 RepID=A0ABX0KX97_9NEIS|nr:DUF5623 domain-containing protein [Iodobacter violacea]NHQ86832.1 DUF5623 domain-containing protein [Iodobacter violacea]
MNIASIRPSTLDGIKQLAKKISREQKISHTIALDVASRQAGYENFVHARRQVKRPLFPVYLTVHWHIPHRDPGELRAGREMWRVDLNRPLPEIVAKHRVAYCRGLHGFRMEYNDHLEHRLDVIGQDAARDLLLTAARGLRFIEATGLQPVTTQKQRDRLSLITNIPGRDHQSQWFDPLTGSSLVLDEPYAPALRNVAGERQGWLGYNNLLEKAPDWQGIYFPGECLPRLIGDNAELLQRISTILASVAPVPVPESWPHETAPYNDDFISPNRQADARPRRPRPGPSWREYKGAVPYGGTAGIPSEWRPKKAMPFELHLQLSPLMQALSSGFMSRVSMKLLRARSSLNEWVIREHKHEHPDVVYDLYYGPQRSPLCKTDAERLEVLSQARIIVERGYDDCKPRRILLDALDAGMTEVAKLLSQNQ